jgi:hypothetical protein
VHCASFGGRRPEPRMAEADSWYGRSLGGQREHRPDLQVVTSPTTSPAHQPPVPFSTPPPQSITRENIGKSASSSRCFLFLPPASRPLCSAIKTNTRLQKQLAPAPSFSCLIHPLSAASKSANMSVELDPPELGFRRMSSVSTSLAELTSVV